MGRPFLIGCTNKVIIIIISLPLGQVALKFRLPQASPCLLF